MMPIVDRSRSAEPVDPEPGRSACGAPFQVYIVEDNEEVRNSFAFLLRTAGRPCTVFSDAADFLTALSDLDPGCLLLDVRMPGLSGIELLAELRRREIDWPVVMMSGHGDVQVAVKSIRGGACEFLNKPFREDRLIEVLERASIDYCEDSLSKAV